MLNCVCWDSNGNEKKSIINNMQLVHTKQRTHRLNSSGRTAEEMALVFFLRVRMPGLPKEATGPPSPRHMT